MANELFHENVPIFMHSEDLNSMKFSIENRSPFLDTKLIEHLYSLNGSHLLNDCKNKFLLRSTLKGILNEKVLNLSVKSGFNASILNLFNLQSKKFINFLKKDSEIYDYVNKSKIIQLSKNTKILKNNGYNKFLFSFISLKTFMEPNEIAVVIGVDIGNWVRLRTESGAVGWYLNFFGYLKILPDADLTSPLYEDIITKKE